MKLLILRFLLLPARWFGAFRLRHLDPRRAWLRGVGFHPGYLLLLHRSLHPYWRFRSGARYKLSRLLLSFNGTWCRTADRKYQKLSPQQKQKHIHRIDNPGKNSLCEKYSQLLVTARRETTVSEFLFFPLFHNPTILRFMFVDKLNVV